MESKRPIFNVPKPTKEEKDAFFKALHKSQANSAILSLIPEYSDNHIPLTVKVKNRMDNLYNPKMNLLFIMN